MAQYIIYILTRFRGTLFSVKLIEHLSFFSEEPTGGKRMSIPPKIHGFGRSESHLKISEITANNQSNQLYGCVFHLSTPQLYTHWLPH